LRNKEWLVKADNRHKSNLNHLNLPRKPKEITQKSRQKKKEMDKHTKSLVNHITFRNKHLFSSKSMAKKFLKQAKKLPKVVKNEEIKMIGDKPTKKVASRFKLKGSSPRTQSKFHSFTLVFEYP